MRCRNAAGAPLAPRRIEAIENVRRRLLALLDGYDCEIWLCGSSVRGDTYGDADDWCGPYGRSDIDIAVLVHGPAPSQEFWDDLAAKVSEATDFCEVDLIDLSGAQPQLPGHLKADPSAVFATVMRDGVRWRERCRVTIA